MSTAPSVPSRFLGDQQFRLEAERTKSRADFLAVNGVHQNDHLRAKFSHGTGFDNFLTRTGDKPTLFPRIDIDDMRNGRPGRIEDIQKGYRLRPGAPYDDASPLDSLSFKVIRPSGNASTENRRNSLTCGTCRLQSSCR